MNGGGQIVLSPYPIVGNFCPTINPTPRKPGMRTASEGETIRHPPPPKLHLCAQVLALDHLLLGFCQKQFDVVSRFSVGFLVPSNRANGVCEPARVLTVD